MSIIIITTTTTTSCHLSLTVPQAHNRFLYTSEQKEIFPLSPFPFRFQPHNQTHKKKHNCKALRRIKRISSHASREKDKS